MPRPLAGLAALLLAAATAYWMYLRNAAGLLWGYRPLLFYLAAIAGIVLLGTRRNDRAADRRRLLSAGSGLLLGLGFPGYLPLPFLLLFAWVPLFIVERELRGQPRSFRRLFGHALLAFLLYNVVATFWVFNTGVAAGLIANVLNALLMTLPWLAFHWTARRSPGVAYLALGAFWISFEYLHHHWDLNWPWLTLGNGFMQFPALVQWYELTGVFGGTAWIIAANWLTYRWLRHPFPRPLPAWPLVAILLPLGGSLVRYLTYAEPPGETVTVAAVQPNFEPHFEKFNGDYDAQLDTFLRLSRAALAEGALDYLAFPETSFGRVNERTPLDGPALRTLAGELADAPLRHLITGVDAHYIFAPGEAVSPNVRYQPRGDGSQLAFEAINGALQFDPATGDFQTYRKGVFVPGAESFPFAGALFFLQPLMDQLGGTVAGRATQPRRSVFTGAARIAPVICYESVFGEYFTGYVRQAGAQAAVVVTNDGWWDDTPGFRQHLWLSSLRAIETRRAIVRSANVGACAFVNQRGDVVSRTAYDRAGYLRGQLKLSDAVTPYVRYGDLIARVSLLLAGMLLLTNLARQLRPDAPSD